MKTTVTLVWIWFMLPMVLWTQSLENIDFISPFHNDMAAIQKDGNWAFINEDGTQIMPFRTDLVLTENDDGTYPMFNDDRCPIVEVKEGISYFGFIDSSGKTVIEPQFLNTTDFNDGIAIALKLDKQVIARNKALGKDVVNYRYFEVLINTDGEITYYLTQDGVNVVLDKDFLRAIPQITSERIAENLFAVRNKNRSWNIIKTKVMMDD